MSKKKFWQALTLTLTVFGFTGWVYIVINSEVHPWTLGRQLTHFWKYPHEDTFEAISFAVSFISFFFYQLVKDDNYANDLRHYQSSLKHNRTSSFLLKGFIYD